LHEGEEFIQPATRFDTQPVGEFRIHRSQRWIFYGCINGYRGKTSPPPRHASDDLVHHPRHVGRIKPRKKAIQRGVVGNGIQFQGGSQFRVLAQAAMLQEMAFWISWSPV
jgi:hypothetical protein